MTLPLMPPAMAARVDKAVAEMAERTKQLGLKKDWYEEFAPDVKMAADYGWVLKEQQAGTWMFMQIPSPNMFVVLSASVEEDMKRWLHVSFSLRDRIPDWKMVGMVKALFIGKDRMAYQILPEEKDYVNLHPYTLHLYSCLDGNVTPDFTHGIGTI